MKTDFGAGKTGAGGGGEAEGGARPAPTIRRMGEARGKALLAVPMVGTGSWDDPKRPAFVLESGVPFRFPVSEDGTMALVEAAPRNLGEKGKLAEFMKKDPRAKLFRPEKDKKSDALDEFKRLKKDFDPEAFGRSGLAADEPRE